jgi:Ca2+-binding RTX toxin-like protein
LASASFTLSGNVENLTLTAGGLTGTGNALANILAGSSGIDILIGGAGDDTLIGGAGNDTHTGGLGNDHFVFAAGFGNDTITDFDSNPTGGQDFIDIHAYGFNAATFAANVSIAAGAAETLVTIAADHIHLLNVASNTVNQSDFIL